MKVHVYRNAAGKYRWRAVAGNGEVIGDSGQGYVRRGYCAGHGQEAEPGCRASAIINSYVLTGEG